jgi:NAD(P)-dependent dehydrogenase (short-subunit alcohol dehydrogenase family)
MDWPYAKTAVITGAASGIGRALAIEAARQGFSVGIVDIDLREAEGTLELVEQAGGSGEVFSCNVRELDEVKATADHFFDMWGEVGLLINNAGVLAFGHVGDIDMKEWQKVLETNLWGQIFGCHAFIPRMKEQGGGHIVNTASVVGIVPPPQQAPYTVSKAGIIGLSETIKTELAPFNIGITVLCPMSVNTNILKDSSDKGNYSRELYTVSFSQAKITPEQIAKKVMSAVEKNKLYLLPNLSGRLFWLSKRLLPSTFFKSLAYLYKKELAVPLLTQLAKRGWL